MCIFPFLVVDGFLFFFGQIIFSGFIEFEQLTLAANNWKEKAMNNLIVICQSGGKFSTASDGSLSYVGGDAHAISVSRETKFDELRLEIADMWKYGTDSMTIKYFLPNNKRTLITISSDKDVQRFLDFHGNSGTVDVFVIKNESSTALAAVTPSTTEATPVPPRKR